MAGNNSESRKKIYYDSLPDFERNYPIDINNFESHNKRYAPRVISHWDSSGFGRCKWEVFDYTNGISYDNLEFNVKEDYKQWKNDNISHSGGLYDSEVNLRVYDVVDPHIPVFSRFQAYNSMYMAMKGKHFYKSKRKTLYSGKDSYQQALVDLWDTVHPAHSGVVTLGNTVENGVGRTLFWTSANRKNMYSMPKADGTESIRDLPASSTPDARHAFDTSTLNIVPLPISSYNVQEVYFLVESGSYGNDYVAIHVSHDNFKDLTRALVSKSGRAVVAFKLVDSFNRYISILVKPLGIDAIWLEGYDDSKYDLEAVYVANNTQIVNFYKIVDFWARGSKNDGTGMFVPDIYKGWPQTLINYRSSKYETFPDVYFRLRRKGSNEVSELSRSKLTCIVGETNAPIKFVIRPGDFNG